MKNATQAKLIAFSGKKAGGKVDQSPPKQDFIRKMLHYEDAKEASQIIGEQAGLEFDQGQGADAEHLKAKQQDLDESLKASKTKLDHSEKKLKNTPQTIKSGSACKTDTDANTGVQDAAGFWGMKTQDQISLSLLFPALATTLVMGSANVYVNLMATGEAVFLEQPFLAVFISMLMPTGSTSLKFIANFFEYHNSKKRYSLCIYSLTATALLTWTVLFAINYTGVAGGVNWETLGESGSSHGSLLVWIQLLSEILVSAALFLAVDEIYLKYNPYLYTENPDYINAEKALKTHQLEHENLRESRGKNMAAIAVLNAARQAYINERIADFVALRARFNQISQF